MALTAFGRLVLQEWVSENIGDLTLIRQAIQLTDAQVETELEAYRATLVQRQTDAVTAMEEGLAAAQTRLTQIQNGVIST